VRLCACMFNNVVVDQFVDPFQFTLVFRDRCACSASSVLCHCGCDMCERAVRVSPVCELFVRSAHATRCKRILRTELITFLFALCSSLFPLPPFSSSLFPLHSPLRPVPGPFSLPHSSLFPSLSSEQPLGQSRQLPSSTNVTARRTVTRSSGNQSPFVCLAIDGSVVLDVAMS